MSGPLSVPFAGVALYSSDTWVQIGFGILAFASGWVAAYGVWFQEHAARLRAEAQLKLPGVILSFHNSIALTSDPPGKFRYLVLVSINNGSGMFLDYCIMQVRVPRPRVTGKFVGMTATSGHDNVYPVCAPFSLLVGESKEIPVLEYALGLGGEKPALVLPTFWKKRGREWTREPGGLLREPGEHQIVFEALSSSQEVTLRLIAKFRNGNWEFSAPQAL